LCGALRHDALGSCGFEDRAHRLVARENVGTNAPYVAHADSLFQLMEQSLANALVLHVVDDRNGRLDDPSRLVEEDEPPHAHAALRF